MHQEEQKAVLSSESEGGYVHCNGKLCRCRSCRSTAEGLRRSAEQSGMFTALESLGRSIAEKLLV